MQPLSIWTHVEILNDRRVERTRRHKLMDILVVSVMAVVCLANGWDDIKELATLREAWPRTLLELANGIPSADTFGRGGTALDPGSRGHLGIERQTVTVTATVTVTHHGQSRRTCASPAPSARDAQAPHTGS
jgi:hypothetical protein